MLLLTWVWLLLPDWRNLGLGRASDPSCLGVARAQTQVTLVLQPLLAQDSGVRCLDSRLLSLAFKKGPKLLDLMLQPDSLKLGLGKFNIIICIIIIIINLIINKFEKNY